jgi:hypothetical protein
MSPVWNWTTSWGGATRPMRRLASRTTGGCNRAWWRGLGLALITGFAGLALRREFGYNWGPTCRISGTTRSSARALSQAELHRIAVRHVLTFGVDWHFRPPII